jgi:hypothetical protein
MRNTESRVVEFILDLDVFENQKRKQQLSSNKQQVSTKWTSLFFQFSKLAEKFLKQCDTMLINLKTSIEVHQIQTMFHNFEKSIPNIAMDVKRRIDITENPLYRQLNKVNELKASIDNFVSSPKYDSM